MAEPLLSVENLVKRYRLRAGGHLQLVRAVEDVSFNIAAGESFGLVGESGSGKSTIGRCVLNLTRPTAGKIVFNGGRRDMQAIFQDPSASLDPRMSAEAIVAEGILKHRLAWGEGALEMARQYLELCGISPSLGKRRPEKFSGGQKQRIGIARALALGPRFIVADEPLSALDVSVQSQILNLMADLREKFGIAFLFISHDLSVVEYFCTRVAVLYLGMIVETGPTDAVLQKPLHPYTEALLSSIPGISQNPGGAEAGRNRIRLRGEIPADIPPGCPFHTRCPCAAPECRTERPALREQDAGGGHWAACVRG